MEAARGQEGDSNIPPTRRVSPETTEVNGATTKVTSKVPENSSLGLLLSDITSLILLSLSTEKFLQKDKQHPSDMYPTGSKRETFQLLEAAGSTIDVLYDLLEKETTVAGPPSDLENTLVKSVPTEITEGKGIEKSTSTDGLSTSLTSCQSGDYLSCESELSRSLEMYRSCEQLIQSPQKGKRDSYSDQHGKAILHSSTMDYKLDGNESSRSLSHLDQRSLLTLDSGIASPFQSASLYRQSHDVSQAKDDSFLPMTSSSSHKEHDIVGRVRKLKITVDQKLRDSLANLSSLYTDDLGTESLREHVRKMQIRYEKATNDQWKAGSMYDVIMDKALATSVLAMENAQLGNEVNALRQELQLTYEQVKEKESKGLFVSRFHDTIMKSPEKDVSDSDDSSSTDISTPDTQLLSSYAQRRKRNFTREDLTTPTAKTQSPSAMSSGKRKLTVPSDLKGPKYLSISTNTTSDSNSSRSTASDACLDDSTDGAGCCGGLFCCFFRRKLDQSEDSISSC
ncbi:uncharacterized protein [Apostichopus japonicus]|uniref:uncharacterized protein isoform X2 n=1 Tax=Stichopus japonicus TaxID=307972 RepID=UPI003AB2CC70